MKYLNSFVLQMSYLRLLDSKFMILPRMLLSLYLRTNEDLRSWLDYKRDSI